jgi:hypothetical protein
VCVSVLSGCRQQPQQPSPRLLLAPGHKHHHVAGSIIIIIIIITTSIIKKEKIAKIVEVVVQAEVIL